MERETDCVILLLIIFVEDEEENFEREEGRCSCYHYAREETIS